MEADPPPQDAEARAQWERARRAWQLSVPVSAEALSLAQRTALFRVCRIKRFEREACLRGLPGPLRSGAFVDLAPLRDALEEAGVPCLLASRGGGEADAPASTARRSRADPPDRV